MIYKCNIIYYRTKLNHETYDSFTSKIKTYYFSIFSFCFYQLVTFHQETSQCCNNMKVLKSFVKHPTYGDLLHHESRQADPITSTCYMQHDVNNGRIHYVLKI